MQEFLLRFLSKELVVFIISMIPIVELRGAIPVGVFLGINPWIAYAISVLGNIVPVPFIILFFRPVIEYLEKTKLFGRFAEKLKKRIHHKAKDMNGLKLFALYLFVAIPLPGTGAWTGAAIAGLMKMRVKHSFFAIAAGVASAGIIMMILSHFGISLFKEI